MHIIQKRYFAVLAVFTILIIPAYADPIVKPTSAGTIKVEFSTDPAILIPGDQAFLKIRFLDKSNQLQIHVDYRVTVKNGNNIVFSTGGIPLHTGEGSISIPYQFQDAGTYQVKVEILGLVFQPIPPETVTFDLNVGGGSTSSNQTSGTIKIPKWVKNNARYWHEGSIDDSTFAQGIQYMIKQGIVTIPPTQSGQAKPGVTIPAWVKNNAGYWSTGDIDDATFVKGIQYLITIGIIQV